MNLFNYLMCKKGHNTSVREDLFAYLLAKNGGTVKTITGTEIYITDAKNRLINRLEMSKLSSQDGEPSPENPVEIKTVKGYRNEFNEALLSQEENYNTYDENTKLWTVFNGSLYSRSIFYNVAGSQSDRDVTKLIYISAGTYTIKFYDFVNNTSTTTDPIEYATFDNDGHLVNKARGEDTYTITVNNDCYLDIRRWSNSGTIQFSKIAIFEGTEELPYVPYGTNYVYKKILGKNLFDKNSLISKVINKTTRYGYKLPKTVDNFYISKQVDDGYGYGLYEDINGTLTRIDSFVTTPTLITSSINDFYLLCISTSNQATAQSYFDANNFMVSYERVVYEPYQESIITIPLNGNEITGTDSTHKDILLVDSDGHCYLQKNTRGLELAIADMDNDENYPGWKNQEQFKADYPNMNTSFSNKGIAFKSNITLDGLAVVSNTVFAPSKGIIMLNESIFNLTQTQWKEQYPELVFKLLYALQTPDIIDLNYNVDIRLFNGVNNISNSDDMNMVLKYY